MRTNIFRRALVAGASVAVATAGLAAVTTTSASAESASIKYDCVIAGYINEQFTAVVDTDLPAKVAAGSKTQANVTVTVTVGYAGPTGVLQTLRNLTADTVEGTATAKTAVDGTAQGDASLTIPAAKVPATGDFILTAKGKAPVFAPTKAGVQTIQAGAFSGNLAFKDAAGNPTPLISTATLSCTPAAGQDLAVDTVEVTKSTVQVTKTTAKVKYAKKAKKATVNVKVVNGKKKAVKGKVKLTLKKGKKVVGKRTVTLNKKGAAKFVFKKVKAKGKYTLVAQYQGTKTTKKSQKTVKFTVK